MRGAVSVALVYLYYDPDGTSDDKQKSSLISATLTVVLFSTLVYGAITKPMLDLLLGAAGAVQCQCLFSPGWLPAQLCLTLFRSLASRSRAEPCGAASFRASAFCAFWCMAAVDLNAWHPHTAEHERSKHPGSDGEALSLSGFPGLSGVKI